MSTTLRRLTLYFLRYLGVRQFRSWSSLDLPFIVHLGDFFGENPYYNPSTHRAEIILMAAWCRQVEHPLILDIGAHNGFIATQVAQLLKDKSPQIYSFEPVPYTFKRLLESVRLLDLEQSIMPICSALSNKSGLVQLCYSEWNSMLAQVVTRKPSERVGDKLAWAAALTMDHIVESSGRAPDLVKLDVEGYETRVFEGGDEVLSGEEPPALCFELNPLTLCECGSNAAELENELCRYEFYYISDFEGQRIALGEPISDLRGIDWFCNIFGVPKTESCHGRWLVAREEAKKTLFGSADWTSVPSKLVGK